MKKALIFSLWFLAQPFAGFTQDPDPGKTSVFGSTKTNESALIGILYDFKQTQNHVSTAMDRRTFERLVGEFIDADWDEGRLNKYYRVSRALYATELQIPQMNADMAPRAFGVEKTVQPRMWLVHYKGQVTSPESGTFRFLGDADDFVSVAVNGKTVLVAHHPGTPIPCKWQPKDQTAVRGAGGGYTGRDWIDIKAGQVIDLDIITGESPGGDYRCFVGIEKKGADYHGKDSPFQLAITKRTPAGAIPWKGIQ